MMGSACVRRRALPVDDIVVSVEVMMEVRMLVTEVMLFVRVVMPDSEGMEETRVWIVETRRAVWSSR